MAVGGWGNWVNLLMGPGEKNKGLGVFVGGGGGGGLTIQDPPTTWVATEANNSTGG